MPVSTSASNHLGADYLRAQEERLTNFSRRFDGEILSFGTTWKDRFFRDHAHLNALGRARFTRSLRDYLTDESS